MIHWHLLTKLELFDEKKVKKGKIKRNLLFFNQIKIKFKFLININRKSEKI